MSNQTLPACSYRYSTLQCRIVKSDLEAIGVWLCKSFLGGLDLLLLSWGSAGYVALMTSVEVEKYIVWQRQEGCEAYP